MNNPVPVIDLFSGPGGLAEGFSPCNSPIYSRRYKIVLSVEKEKYAYDTLILRAFLRQFNGGFPTEYYDLLNHSTPEPDWEKLYPNQWQTAKKETKMLEIGTSTWKFTLQKCIEEIKAKYGERVVLMGGPPCQAYSLAGRARTAGMEHYDPAKDPRIYHYQNFLKIVSKLKPVITLMENVKGIISSSVDRQGIFQNIMNGLQSACGRDSYQLCALSPSMDGILFDNLSNKPKEFIVRTEEFGIPQARHRVFIVGIRSDIAQRLPANYFPKLIKIKNRISVESVIGTIPKLRSGLSRSDSSMAWGEAVSLACDDIGQYVLSLKRHEQDKFLAAIELARCSADGGFLDRSAGGNPPLSENCPQDLRNWLYDVNLSQLPNHESRGHMSSDLKRYIFAASFARTFNCSPKTDDFPHFLAANHKSWNTKKFADRFRVQLANHPAKTITSHIAKDGHYFIHPDPSQCRSITVREAARLQTFPDNYLFKGNRTEQYVQVGNAVPPFLAHQIANCLWNILNYCDQQSLFVKHENTSKLII